MFDPFYRALAASAGIGIVMEYLMEVVKKAEPKNKSNLIIFDYKCIQGNPDSRSTRKK